MTANQSGPQTLFFFKGFQIAYLMAIMLVPLYLGAVHLWTLSISAVLISFSLLFLFVGIIHSKNLPCVRTPLDYWIILYGVVFVFAVAHSRIQSYSLVESFKLLVSISVFYATVYYCRERRDIQNLGKAIIILGGGLSFFGLLQYIGALPKGWWHIKQFLSSVYVNHNHFAGLLELVMPVSLGFTLAERDRSKKVFFIFSCCLMATAFVLTFSRGGAVSMALGLLLMLLLLLKFGLLKRGWPIFAVIFLFLAVVLFLFDWDKVFARLGTLQTAMSGDTSFADRLLIWKGAWAVIMKYPWLGTGPGTFGYAFLAFRPEGYYHRPEFAHNDYLNLISDCGWLAFFVVLLMFGALILSGYRIIHQDKSRLRVGVGTGCLGSLVCLAVHSAVDFNLHIPANWVWASAIGGLLISLDSDKKYPVRFKKRTAVAFFIFAGIGLLAGSAVYGGSDYLYWRGKIYNSLGQREEALFSLDGSIRRNPYNDKAYFLRGLIKEDLAENATKDFERAMRVNPLEPYYDYHWIVHRLIKGEISASDAVSLLGLALAKDSVDPKLRFLAGRVILLQQDGDLKSKSIAFNYLDNAVHLDPRYLKAVNDTLYEVYGQGRVKEEFPLLAFTGAESISLLMKQQDFWAPHRDYLLKRYGIDPQQKYEILAKNQWVNDREMAYKLSSFRRQRSTTRYGKDLINCNDTLTREILLKHKLSRLLFRARGTPAAGSYPYLIIKIDDRIVDAIYVRSRFVSRYDTILSEEPGTHTLAVEFVNDYQDPWTREDRNLWIDSIEIQYPIER